MAVRVEAATIDDVDVITPLWVALVEGQQRYGAHLLGAENSQSASAIIKQYVLTGNVGVAVEAGGPIVGFVMFHVETGVYEQDVTRGIVGNVFVVESARGQGIGTKLMDYAEKRLREEGVDVVGLSVLAANENARRLYAERGYRPHRIEMERDVEPEGPDDA